MSSGRWGHGGPEDRRSRTHTNDAAGGWGVSSGTGRRLEVEASGEDGGWGRDTGGGGAFRGAAGGLRRGRRRETGFAGRGSREREGGFVESGDWRRSQGQQHHHHHNNQQQSTAPRSYGNVGADQRFEKTTHRQQRPSGAEVGEGGSIRRGRDLPLDKLDVNHVYKGIVYSFHDTHGFFLHFGEQEKEGEEFRAFPMPGRITRSGLPARMQAQCEASCREFKQGHHTGFIPVKVKTITKEERSNKPRVELMLVPTKKLLILDLNGVLFNRYSSVDERIIRKEVLKRPGCEAFLDFCFETFDVAAWSCVRKETMELSLFGEHEKDLTFVNHSVHSTNLWPRHSVVSTAKPLFLKELPKLWAQYDRVAYDATNTILIDNHLEKFEGNPLGTCVVVPQYEDKSDPPDTVLALSGELVSHLKQISVAEDSSRYVRETSSRFFPTAHPEPPRDEKAIVKKALLEVFCSSPVMREEKPELTVEWYMARNETPGPRAVQLRRKTLKEVASTSRPHLVCDKTDGKRVLLFVPGSRTNDDDNNNNNKDQQQLVKPGAYLIDRHWDLEWLDYDEKLKSVLNPRGGATLLDGELLEKQPDNLYLIFDVIFLDGQDVGSEPSLLKRMHILRDFFQQQQQQQIPARFAAQHDVSSSHNKLRGADEYLLLTPKVFYEISELAHVLGSVMKKTAQNGGDGGDYLFDDGVRQSKSDGLVFTPATLPYYLYHVYKYKAPARVSVDFKVKLADMRGKRRGASIPLYLLVQKFDTKFTDLDVSCDEDRQRLYDHMELNNLSECIIECDFSHATGLWTLRTIRTDKGNPNSLQTAWNNVECIAENLRMEVLIKELEDLSRSDDGGGGEEEEKEEGQGWRGDDDAVAAHYDEFQQRRWADAESTLDARIHNLRRLNNWIKSVLIERCCKDMLLITEEGGGSSSNGNKPQATNYYTDELKWLSNPLETDEQRQEQISKGNSVKHEEKRRRSRRPGEEKFSVLDLACGRGGDFKKWALQGADVYVGIDISSQSVAECQSRVNSYDKDKRHLSLGRVLTRSMLDPQLPSLIRRGTDLERQCFDFISIQFAIHYAFDCEKSLIQLLSNVSELLSSSGLLLMTSIDARALQKHLTEENNHNKSEFGNSVYHIKFAADSRKEENGLGQRYTFTLSSAVEACDEYVVHMPSLVRLAREVTGLELVYYKNFGEITHEQLEAGYGSLLEPLKVGSISQDEWEAIHLYAAMVFRRAEIK